MNSSTLTHREMQKFSGALAAAGVLPNTNLLRWHGKDLQAEAQRVIARSFFVVWAQAFSVLLLGQHAGLANALGWLRLAFFELFALAIGCLVFVKRT